MEMRAHCRCVSHLRPSAWLDVAMTPEQLVLLDPTPEDLTVREIMRDCGGIGAIKKLAKRKLDAAGFINSDCCEANGPERTKRLKQALQLASSMAEIERDS